MKKIRLTEKDLQRIVKRVIKEDGDYTPSYDIQSFDCGNNVRSGSVDLDGKTIVIRYCRDNEEDLEYLKEKGLRLLQWEWEHSLPNDDAISRWRSIWGDKYNYELK